MHVSPRPGGAGAVRIIVMHINVGPDTHAGAPAFIANVLSHEDGGYHAVVDDIQVAVAAQPDQLVYGASGANEDGYHVCLLGDIQTPAQWDDAFSRGEINVAAKFVAEKCHELGIPPEQLTDPRVADKVTKGICDHWAVNRAIVQPANARGDHSMGPGDHTDVGAGFPWETFISLVKSFHAAGPIPPPGIQEEPVLIPAPTQPDVNQWRGAVVNLAAHTMTALGGAIIKPPLDPVEQSSPWVGVSTIGAPVGSFVIVADTPDKRNNAPYRHTVS